MRFFDLIGAVIVAAWLAFTGAYVWEHEFADADDAAPAATADGQIALEEGQTWLMMRRDDRDIGFVHQTRTRLTDGWLVEYDMLAMLEVLERKLALQTTVKARLDAEAYLREFSADMQVAGQTFKATGDVRTDDPDRHRIDLSIDIGDSVRRRTVELPRRPRLASNAVQQLLAQPDLQSGDSFRQSYFDATSMGMTAIEMEYVGRETIEVLGETHDARHIRQTVAGRTLDVYVDAAGRILIQEFPLQIVGSRVAPELGRARASALRKEARQLETKLPDSLLSNLDGMLGMLGFGGDSGLLPALPDPDTDTAPSKDTTHD